MADEEDFDWDNDDFDPDSGFVKKDENEEWKDEDKEIMEQLQEEEEDPKKKADVPAVTKKTKQERIEEKKALRRMEKSDEQSSENTANQLAEKLRLQKAQEDSDLEITKDLFGVGVASPPAGTIDSMHPKTSEEFDTFREAIQNKLKTLESSTLYVGFLDKLLRDVSVSLEVEDIRRLSNTLTHIANEKQKAAKGAKSKKKGGAKLAGGKAAKKIMGHDDFDGEMGAEFDDFL